MSDTTTNTGGDEKTQKVSLLNSDLMNGALIESLLTSVKDNTKLLEQTRQILTNTELVIAKLSNGINEKITNIQVALGGFQSEVKVELAAYRKLFEHELKLEEKELDGELRIKGAHVSSEDKLKHKKWDIFAKWLMGAGGAALLIKEVIVPITTYFIK